MHQASRGVGAQHKFLPLPSFAQGCLTQSPKVLTLTFRKRQFFVMEPGCHQVATGTHYNPRARAPTKGPLLMWCGTCWASPCPDPCRKQSQSRDQWQLKFTRENGKWSHATPQGLKQSPRKHPSPLFCPRSHTCGYYPAGPDGLSSRCSGRRAREP